MILIFAIQQNVLGDCIDTPKEDAEAIMEDVNVIVIGELDNNATNNEIISTCKKQ
jgi:hypothetical protein